MLSDFAMIKLLFFLLCCFALAAARRASRIRNGGPVAEVEARTVFPFVAYVEICDKTAGCFSCTGSLVADDRVLTSAHCFCGSHDKITVYLKDGTVGRKGRLLKQGKFDCEMMLESQDIAVVQLTKAAPAEVKPVPLECGSYNPGGEVTMIGYGLDEKEVGGVLRIGQGTTRKCDKGLSGAICMDGTDPRATATSYGDSGGPLLISRGTGYAQVGVTHGAVAIDVPIGGKVEWKTTLIWTAVQPFCAWILS